MSKFEPTASETAERVHLAAAPQSAALARRYVRKLVGTLGFDDETQGDIDLAVGEAVTNAIEHGSRQSDANIQLRAFVDVGALVIEIHDSGPGFDPGTARTTQYADAIEERGRGLTIIRALMDDLILTRTADGMTVRMTRRLPG